MITCIIGLTGSGKTFIQTMLLHQEWKHGAKISVNYPVFFSKDNEDVERYHQLDELYSANNRVIGIDEGQKLFDARRWYNLPANFAEKIAGHRHDHLDIITNTQDLGHIDARIRQNIHQLYRCVSVFRFPQNDRVKPIIQMIRATKQIRKFDNLKNRITWERANTKLYFLSRYWTKTLYNTYTSIYLDRYICRIKYEKLKGWKTGQWTGKIYSRELVNSGKARI
jgi:hypothetical protein